MIPKGTLLIIGGALYIGDQKAPDTPSNSLYCKQFEILQFLLKEKKKVEIITTGSNYPNEVEIEYQRAFDLIGIKNTGYISITNKDDAGLSKYIQRIEKANAIFFSGGDQSRLSNILGRTPLIQLISKRYYEDENFVVAGTSAGAMVMSKIMICTGGNNEVVFKNDLKTAAGFGLLEHCIIDSHFIKRGRFGRLAHAVLINPGQLGVGLGEDTALIVKNGQDAECLGSGAVVIIDSSTIRQSNISEVVNDECGVFVEDLRVHLLIKGCHFNLKTRMITRPDNKPGKKMEDG